MLRAYSQGTIFGEPYGDGPAQVLWLHGWRRTSADFATAANAAASAGVSSVALDLPGHGSSPLPPSAGGAALYAELLMPVLAECSPGPLVLVGHSFGGRVAVVLAARHPDVVRALVVTGSPLVRLSSSRRSPLGYRTVRALHRRRLVSEARMEAARQKYGSSDYRNASGMLREILVRSVNEDYEPDLASVRAPVALVWGENDVDVPLEVATRTRDLLVSSAHVDLDVLSGVGHLVPVERPDALVTHALALLGGP